MTNAVSDIVISGWSVISPYGRGQSAWQAGLGSRCSAIRAVANDELFGPFKSAAQVPDFSPQAALGRRNTRTMDRLTALAVAASGDLIKDAPLDVHGAHATRTGLVLGTASGSVASMMDFVEDSFTQPLPYQVDPARFPNAVMNRAASCCAMWWGLRGPNAKVAGGSLSGMLALSYTSRLLRAGRAVSVLCGAAEEHSRRRSWLEHAAGRQYPPGEGVAFFVVEPQDVARSAGRRALARVLHCKSAAVGDGEVRRAVKTAVSGALDHAARTPGDVTVVLPMASGNLAEAERSGWQAVLGPKPTVELAPHLGQLGGASVGLQLAALLASWGAAGEPSSGDGSEEVALLVGADHDDMAGAMLVERSA